MSSGRSNSKETIRLLLKMERKTWLTTSYKKWDTSALTSTPLRLRLSWMCSRTCSLNSGSLSKSKSRPLAKFQENSRRMSRLTFLLTCGSLQEMRTKIRKNDVHI